MSSRATFQSLVMAFVLAIVPLGMTGCGDDDGTPSGMDCTSISVLPETATVHVGATQQFLAECTLAVPDEEGNTTRDVSTEVTWTSSDEAIATVASGGLATAMAAGSATITAIMVDEEGLSVQGSATLEVTEKTVTSLQVTPATADIPITGTQQYTATANYEDGTTEDVTSQATWASSDTGVATIDSTGLASAVSSGATQISAVYEGITGTALLTVSDKQITDIEVTPTNPTIEAGLTQQFAATAIYDDASTEDVTDSVKWASTDNAIATVSNDPGTEGLASGIAAGTADISATMTTAGGDVVGSTTLTVTQSQTLDYIQVTPKTESTWVGGSDVQFTATAVYMDSTTADVTAAATWDSSDQGVATIGTNDGLASPVAVGSTTITATYNGMTDTATLDVTAAVITGITVTPGAPTIPDGTTQQFTAMADMSDGTQQNITATASWQSLNLNVATIVSGGLATAVGPGTADITATQGGQTGTATLTVTAATLETIEVNPPLATIADGTTQQYTATGHYSDGSTQTITDQVTWSTEDNLIATISNAAGSEGLATAVDPGGPITITATLLGIDGTAMLTVTAATVTSIVVTPVDDTIARGMTLQYTAMANFTDGTQQNVTSSASWSAAPTSVATITQTGLATGEAAGEADISAAYGGEVGTTTLTVTAAAVTNITISVTATNNTIVEGTTTQFTAIADMSDGTQQNVTDQVTWFSDDTDVLEFSTTAGDEGEATGMGVGTADVYARMSGVDSNTITITVISASLVSIDIEPTAPDPMAIGSTEQFTATGNYDDGSSADITDLVTWYSTNLTKAHVSNATGIEGEVTALSGGTSEIYAVLDGVESNYVTVTVISVTTGLSYITVEADVDYPQISSDPAFPIMINTGGLVFHMIAMGHYGDGRPTADISDEVILEPVDNLGTPITHFTAAYSAGAGAIVITGNTSTSGLPAGNGFPAGQGRLRVRQGTIETYVNVKVTSSTVSSVAVTCGPPRTCLPSDIGLKVRCTALATFSDGTTGDVTAAGTTSWTSTNTNVAENPVVNGDYAVVTIDAAGTTVIQATSGGTPSSPTDANATLEAVTGMTYTSLTVEPTNPEKPAGMSQQFKAIAEFDGGGACTGSHDIDVTILAGWDTGNELIAVESNAPGEEGLVNAKAEGSTSVDASYDGEDGSTTFIVTNPCPVSLVDIELASGQFMPGPTPSIFYVPAQTQIPLTVNAQFSDGPGTITVGTMGDWSSSDVDPNTWILDVGTTDPGPLTFTVGACDGTTLTEHITVLIDTDAWADSLSVWTAMDTISMGTFSDFRAWAQFKTLDLNGDEVDYGSTINVSAKSTWSFYPDLGLGHQPAPLTSIYHPAERFTHTGDQEGVTEIFAVYSDLSAKGTLTITDRDPIDLNIDDVYPPEVGGEYPTGLRLEVFAEVDYSDGNSAINPSDYVVRYCSADAGEVRNTDDGGPPTSCSLSTNPNMAALWAVYNGSTSFASNKFVTVGDDSSTRVWAIVCKGDTMCYADYYTVNIKNGVGPDHLTTSEGDDGATTSMRLGEVRQIIVYLVDEDGDEYDVSSWVIDQDGLGQEDETYINSYGEDGKIFMEALLDTTDFGGAGDDYVGLAFGNIPDVSNISIDVSATAVCYKELVLTSSTSVQAGAGDATKVQAMAVDLDDHQLNVTAVCTSWSWDDYYLDRGALDTSGTSPDDDFYPFEGDHPTTGATVSCTLWDNASTIRVCADGDINITSITGEVDVVVTAAAIDTVEVLPGPVGSNSTRRIPGGEGIQLRAIAELEDGTTGVDVSASCTWDDSGDMTVNSSGWAVAASGAGTGWVRATCGPDSVEGTLDFTVRDCGDTPDVTWGFPTSMTKGDTFRVTADVDYIYGGAGCTTSEISTAEATFTDITARPALQGTWSINEENETDPDPSCTDVLDLAGYMLTAVCRGDGDVRLQYRSTDVERGVTVGSGSCVSEIVLDDTDIDRPAGAPFRLTYTCNSNTGGQTACSPTFYVQAGDDPDGIIDDFAGDLDEGIAAVDASAMVGDASAVITAEVAGCNGVDRFDTVTINVAAGELGRIFVNDSYANAAMDTAYPFEIRGEYVDSIEGPDCFDDSDCTGQICTWWGTCGTKVGEYDVSAGAIYTSSNVDVADPENDGTGYVTTQDQLGSAYISAEFGGTYSINAGLITVTDKRVQSLTITAEPNRVGGSSSSATYPSGGFNLQLWVRANFSDGSSEDRFSSNIVWELEEPSIGTVGLSPTGLFTTASAGTDDSQDVRAVYSYDDGTEAYEVESSWFTVNMEPGDVTDIEIVNENGDAPDTSVGVGMENVPYHALVTLQGSSVQYWATRNVTWTRVNDGAQASINNLGLLDAGNAEGDVDITATRSATDTITVSITDAEPVYLYCAPAVVPGLNPGMKVQLYAYAMLSNGDPDNVTLNPDTTWASTDSTVADFLGFDPSGVITTLVPGVTMGNPSYEGFTTDPANQCFIEVLP